MSFLSNLTIFSQVGDICVAYFDEDGTFYRAKITEVLGEGRFNVHFIDFGNNAISDKLRTVPKAVADLPVCCHRCSVSDIKDEAQFSDTMDKYFGQKFKIQILESSGDHWKIDILINGVSIADELRKSKDNVNMEVAPNLVDSFKNCRVIFSVSPNDFYVKFNEDFNTHESIKEILLVGESFDKLESPKVGDFCVAKYPADGAYYRAQVTSVNKEGVEVIFIDFGNTSIVDDLRVFPENAVLKNVNTRAKHCALENLTDVDFWSEEAIKVFTNIIENTHFNETFQVEILQTHTDPWIVRLYLQNDDVAKKMISKIQDPSQDSDNTTGSIINELVRGITELDADNSMVLHSKDIVMDIIDNIHCSSGHGSMDVTPT